MITIKREGNAAKKKKGASSINAGQGRLKQREMNK
jgi:hypothetical protein